MTREPVPSLRRSAPPRRVAIGLALWSVLSVACAPDARPPNVVVLVLDTARPDYLSVYGHPAPTTPFLEEFARSSTLFERAYSSSSWTLPAHATLFTGEPPRVHRADQSKQGVAPGLPLLAEQLAAAGYRTAGFSGNAWISARSALDRGFEHFERIAGNAYTDRIRSQARDRTGRSEPAQEHYVLARVFEWLESTRADERPLFLFVNLVDAHMPYLPDERSIAPFLSEGDSRWEGIRRFFPDANARPVCEQHYARQRPLEESEWTLLRAMYEGALRVVDELAAALVKEVDEELGVEETLLFVLSDHGENLGDHGHLHHIFNLYDSNLRIALLARGPGFEPGRAEPGLVQIADLNATILAAAGLGDRARPGTVDLRETVPGDRVVTAELDPPRVSMLMFSKETKVAGSMNAYKRALVAAVGPRYKLIRSSTGEEELFDLSADPGETRPLRPGDVDPEALAGLEAALERLAAREPAPFERTEQEVDEETRKALQAMGYAGEEDGEH